MKTTGANGPFVEGNFAFVPTHSKDVKENEHAYALPIYVNGSYHLLALFVGNQLTEEDEQRMKEMIQEGIETELGISIKTLKN